MNNIVLYLHSGSKNHGCEAIVRGTVKVLDNLADKITLLSQEKSEDLIYGIENLIDVETGMEKIDKKSFDFLKAYIDLKLKKDTSKMDALQYKIGLKNIDSDSIIMSVGGDTYCYSNVYTHLEINKMYRKKAKKSVLWGCSVEPKLLKDDKIIKDISGYSLIIARESISYDALKKVNKNTYLCPDPAFQLDIEDVELPNGFLLNNTIGINLSPLIMKCEEKQGITLKNYENFIQYIINNTDMNIALIPHVVWKHNDDREPLNKLYEKFKLSNRVVMIKEDYNAMQLKSIISKCRMFIGARTHATIAAYSTCVPTLVVGYSIKAKGIAKDIFGTYENYVLPVQSLSNKDDLINAFEWMKDKEDEIRKHLNEFIPGYKAKALQGKIEIEKLLEE